MQTPRLFVLLSLFILCLLSTDQTNPHYDNAESCTIKKNDPTEQNFITRTNLEHIKTLRVILRDFINICNDGRINSINKIDLQNWVFELDACLQDATNKPALLTELLHLYIDLATKAFDTQFTLLPTPTKTSLASILKKNISTDEEQRLLLLNVTTIKTLEEKVRNAGLTFYNKIARTIAKTSNFVVPYLKWSLIAMGLWYLKNKLAEKQKIPIILADGKQASIDTPYTHIFLEKLWETSISTTVGLAATAFINNSKDTFIQKYNLTCTYFKNLWNKIKGSPSMLDTNGYKIIEENDIVLNEKNIIGLSQQMNELSEMLKIAFNPKGYISKNHQIQRCFLFQGPSGCGKTYLALYLGKLINHIFNSSEGLAQPVKFKTVERQELSYMFLSQIIADARRQGGIVILFIDEIHLLQTQDNQNALLLNEFLTEMTALHNIQEGQGQVFIIGATNNPGKLDVAMTVAGRFKPINFDYPSASHRKLFFATHLPDAGFKPTDEQLDSYTKQTVYKSFADLKKVINCKTGSGELLTHEHIQAAIFKEIHNFGNAIHEVNPAEKKIIAIHQAGQAIIHLLLRMEEELQWVTVTNINKKIKEKNCFNIEVEKENPNEPKPKSFGALICYQPSESLHGETVIEKQKRCKRLLAGRCAQKIMLGTYNTMYRIDDYTQACLLAQEIILDGKSMKELSAQRKNDIHDAAEKLLEEYTQEVTVLLTQNQEVLNKTALLLEEQTIVAGPEIASFLEHKEPIHQAAEHKELDQST